MKAPTDECSKGEENMLARCVASRREEHRQINKCVGWRAATLFLPVLSYIQILPKLYLKHEVSRLNVLVFVRTIPSVCIV